MREMKDSGIPWIGEVPSHWEIILGKKLYISNDGGVWGEEPTGKNDVFVLRSTEQDIDGRLIIVEPAKRHLSDKEIMASTLLKDDLIITKSSGSPTHIGKTSIIDETIASLKCCYSNFLQRIRVQGEAKYYWYAFNSVATKEQFSYLSTTTTGINNINSKIIASVIFPLPPLSEQKLIADYLDRKCGEIDELVVLQEKMIEELKSYKQSVITEAVTKGLNPNAPMKDSGIEWEPQVPNNWNKVFLKWFYVFEKGKNAATYTADYIGLHSGAYPVYSGQTENNGIMGHIDSFEYNINECLFTTTVGAKVMTPKILSGKFSLSQNCLIMHKTKSVSNNFIYYLLLTLFAYEKSLIPSYMQPSLRVEDLKRYYFFLPPLSEQQAIADYLDEKCAEIDSLIALKQQKIEQLKEYKKSLIYEYVTGKKQVESTDSNALPSA